MLGAMILMESHTSAILLAEDRQTGMQSQEATQTPEQTEQLVYMPVCSLTHSLPETVCPEKRT